MMETFLQQVAHDLYQKTHGDFTRVAVVFPNKRAGLFFDEYLAHESGQPLWSPAYITISELFREASEWEIADPVKLVCDLYKVFKQHVPTQETLDEFYFWGEMLISDFDDADKNLVAADTLFSNLKDLGEMGDGLDFLEEGQREALETFFRNFSINRVTELKRRFISLWDSLGNIYHDYKSLLADQRIAYEGMMYRQVMEHFDTGSLPYDTYAFVGFNVLNKVEHKLFKTLKDAGKARFYWDYDVAYLHRKPHEAGEFIRRNLTDFPSELPASCFDNLNKPKDITYIQSPTENGEVRYLPQWIRRNLTQPEKETAVVLCNEALLPSMLHALPENVHHTNITMGFPLTQTPVYSFVKALLELHIEGYNPNNGRYRFAEVTGLLKHPYTRRLSPHADALEQELTQRNRFYPLPSELQQDDALTLLFTPREGCLSLCRMLAEALEAVAVLYREEASTDAFGQLYRESLFKAYTLANRFKGLVESHELDVRPATLMRLMERVMTTTSIPFHGEPAIGLQVMGVLETRNLDFRHLILLSVGEGHLPKGGGDASFIPYNLRKAFGMTTIDHKIAVYAYYFYRLLQRAERVTLVYDTAPDSMGRGEQSRFMLQFLIEWPHPIRMEQLEAAQSPQKPEQICIAKTPEVQKRMRELYDIRNNVRAQLSPSALNCYLDCRLRFYFRYIAKLTAPETVNADVDASKFGQIFHHAAEHIYKDLTTCGKNISTNDIEKLLEDDQRLHGYVDDAFKKIFFNLPQDAAPEYDGIQLINAEVIVRYLQQLLRTDLRYAPFNFLASEYPVNERIDINTPDGIIQTTLQGTIDRMDQKGDTLRIVDYKTGGKADTPPDMASLFTPHRQRSNYVFQTFLYAAIVCRKLREQGSSLHVAPSLLYIHRAASEDYSPVISIGKYRAKEVVDDFARYEEEFNTRLKELLEEIFHPQIPFNQTTDEEKCQYCDYKELCKR